MKTPRFSPRVLLLLCLALLPACSTVGGKGLHGPSAKALASVSADGLSDAQSASNPFAALPTPAEQILAQIDAAAPAPGSPVAEQVAAMDDPSEDVLAARLDMFGMEGVNAGDQPDSRQWLDHDAEGEAKIADPFETINRGVFWFNDKLFVYVIDPAATGYNYVTPEILRTGIRNAFHNIQFPVRFINNMLQGKFMHAGVEFARFVGNTAFGGLGLSNAFDHMPSVVEVKDDEDTGQTLGSWGMGPGFFIVWPILGPSTARDSAGLVGDWLMDPLTYLSTPFWSVCAYASPVLRGSRQFNEISFRIDEYNRFRKQAVEPYTSMKNAYVEYRARRIQK